MRFLLLDRELVTQTRHFCVAQFTDISDTAIAQFMTEFADMVNLIERPKPPAAPIDIVADPLSRFRQQVGGRRTF